MLVLTRRTGESLFVTLTDGSVVEVFVASVRGNSVRLSIKAPRHVQIWREEVAERIRREKLAPDGNVA